MCNITNDWPTSSESSTRGRAMISINLTTQTHGMHLYASPTLAENYLQTVSLICACTFMWVHTVVHPHISVHALTNEGIRYKPYLVYICVGIQQQTSRVNISTVPHSIRGFNTKALVHDHHNCQRFRENCQFVHHVLYFWIHFVAGQLNHTQLNSSSDTRFLGQQAKVLSFFVTCPVWHALLGR